MRDDRFRELRSAGAEVATRDAEKPMRSSLPNTSGLAFLDVLSNGVGAAVLLITIFGASLVAQTRGLPSNEGIVIQITAQPDVALAALLRTKDGSIPVALTELDESGVLSDHLVNVGTTAAVTSVRRTVDRMAILSVVAPSIEYMCIAVYTPVLHHSGPMQTKATINAGESRRRVSVGLLRPSTWVSVRRVRGRVVLGECDAGV